MINIIETNISYDNNDNIKDFQSRIIKYESWKEFVTLFEKYSGEACGYCNGTMIGNVLPKSAQIYNLEFDENHLKCDIKLWIGFKQKKLAYLIPNTEVI